MSRHHQELPPQDALAALDATPVSCGTGKPQFKPGEKAMPVQLALLFLCWTLGAGCKGGQDEAGSSTIRDCAGTPGGSAYVDDCGVCDDDPTNDNTSGSFDSCGHCDDDPTNDCMTGLDYYGTNVPLHLTPVPRDYEVFDPDVSFGGGLHGMNHEATASPGAGKFVFNRIFRAHKHGLNFGDQFGVFHWWLRSFGNNSIEGGVWVNPIVAGPHYYPTLHLAGIGDQYHVCNDVQSGGGLYGVNLGDRWLTMIHLSNRVLFVPGVNIAFDKDQPPHHDDNGIWVGWGWTYLNLDHPRGFKFWVSAVETYDYQGFVNGYIPEHFNFIDPEKVRNGDYRQRSEDNDPFGTFATHGASGNGGIANEQYTQGLRLGDNTYYLPVPRVPSRLDREYVIANVQSIAPQTMEDYSRHLKEGTDFESLIRTRFLSFNGLYDSTHSQLKVRETVDGQEHLIVIEPPFDVGYETYNGYVEWDNALPEVEAARLNGNGHLYYQRTTERWPVEQGAGDELVNHPHLYRGKLILPPDDVQRVPRVDGQYFNYKERDANHPDFAHWDTTGMTRYTTLLQNGSTATYVWFRFIDQPAMKTARNNWPGIYTTDYLVQLQSYIEELHRVLAQGSTENPSDPVLVNYRNPDNSDHFEPHLARIDPRQLVEPPAGFEVGYVPVIISVYHPEAHSRNGTGFIEEPDTQCSNAQWSAENYFPDITDN
jgi:hypothetical protein